MLHSSVYYLSSISVFLRCLKVKITLSRSLDFKKNAYFYRFNKHYCGDQHKLQAKLLPTVPQKVAGQAASRVGLPVAKG